MREAIQHSEGPVARALEQQTAKLPSDLFLWAALGSILVSLTMKLLGDDHRSLFVGQWAPTFLILGIYNKLADVLHRARVVFGHEDLVVLGERRCSDLQRGLPVPRPADRQRAPRPRRSAAPRARYCASHPKGASERGDGGRVAE